ncbi:hypothetical protein [Salinarimonas chemoclinalis]|uniref:hypothetical protein n=1 Tax=Salinarimonas chemoclinalis TaxID=3241599 RepID=UPI003557D8B1
MAFITVEIDDEVLEKVAAYAAARGTAPEGLLKAHLEHLALIPPAVRTDLDEARRKIRELAETSPLDVGPITWTRESLYDRDEQRDERRRAEESKSILELRPSADRQT